MASIIPEGYARVTYQMRLAGDPEPMLCTVGLKLDGPGTLAMATALLTAFRDAWDNHSSTSLTFSGVKLEVGTAAGEPVIFEVAGTATGTLAQTFLPPNSAYLMKKLTAVGGRKHKGRMYLPFASEGNVDITGQMDAGTVASLTTTAQNWQVATIAIAGVEELVILHEDAAITPTVITNVAIDARIATQRRRLRP